MWSFNLRNDFSVSELMVKIKDKSDLIEGITFLGGEPFDQFDEILELLSESKKIGISTMVFTGFEMKEIIEKGMKEILNFSDILITGRYDENKRTLNHQWIGSTNQEIHFLSNTYKTFVQKDSNYVEVSIDELGSTTFLGFPDEDFMNALM